MKINIPIIILINQVAKEFLNISNRTIILSDTKFLTLISFSNFELATNWKICPTNL